MIRGRKGKRLSKPNSPYRELNGISAVEYLNKAKAMFEEMDLQWDLEQLEQVVAVHHRKSMVSCFIPLSVHFLLKHHNCQNQGKLFCRPDPQKKRYNTPVVVAFMAQIQ
jgi:hypothetical protein